VQLESALKVTLQARPLKVALQARPLKVALQVRPLKVTLQARPLKMAVQAWHLELVLRAQGLNAPHAWHLNVVVRAQDLNALQAQHLRMVLQAWNLKIALLAQNVVVALIALLAQSPVVALQAQDLNALQAQRLKQVLKVVLQTQSLLVALQGLKALQAQSLKLVLRAQSLRVPSQVQCRPVEEPLLHRVVPLERCRALSASQGCHRHCFFISYRPIAAFLPFTDRQLRTFIMTRACWGTSRLFTSTLAYLGTLAFLISRETSKDIAFCHSRLHVRFPLSVSESLLTLARRNTCDAVDVPAHLCTSLILANEAVDSLA